MSESDLRLMRGHRALRAGRASLEGHFYHVTARTHDRQPLFADFWAARVVVRSLNTPALLGTSQLFAWVLMPDHLHALVQLGEQDTLQSFVNRVKGASARSLNRHLRRAGPVWQRAYHDHLVRNDENLENVGRYIVMNPLRAGLVRRAGEYPHWDAIWLSPL